MKKISNNSYKRANITYSHIYFDDVFKEEEITRIVEYCETKEFLKGGLLSNDLSLNETIRKSNVNFHNPNKENNWIFERLNWAIERINDDFYNLDLNGYDSFQYSQYKSAQLGKYDWHIDMFTGDASPTNNAGTRKLSLTFLLSEPNVDFEGGDFQITQGSENQAQTIEMKKGRIIAFPSFILHRVTPVTKGERKSIVIWVEGPKFK
jgi:PKHD-type hydroxylase